MRKIFVTLVTLLLLTIVATLVPAQDASVYTEAPMLAEMVAAGDLPPVEERLPNDPVVIPVEDAIGEYGGELVTWDTQFNTGACQLQNIRETSSYSFVYYNPRTTELEPNILTSWELSDDLQELTMTLRTGLHWSDGAPVTTEDVSFWWNDIQTYTDLFPTIDSAYTTVGDDGVAVPMEVIILDDLTFQFAFAHPNPGFVSNLSQNIYLSPKHYLSQFHPNYVDNSAELASDAGFDTWIDFFSTISESEIAQTNVDLPVLRAWVLESVDSSNTKVYVRNPYFWKVDEAGNQLPYVDYYERTVVESAEIGFARSLTGEFNLSLINLTDIPLAIAEQERGGFRVYLTPTNTAADGFAFAFNYTLQDAELSDVFNDIRFRQAISYSINRDEWNDLFHLGLGIPRQAIPGPDTSFYVDGIDQLYTQYDVELANQLLDEMGLVWQDGEDYRTLPSGAPFIIQTPIDERSTNKWEIMQQYWATIGVGLDFTPISPQLLREQLQTNEVAVGSWGGGGAGEFFAHSISPIRYVPPWHFPFLAQGGLLWSNWHTTGGAEGEVPPEIIQQLFQIVDEWTQQPFGSEDYISLGEQILTINAENLWWFGVVGYDPQAWIIGANLRNLPAEDTLVPTDICGSIGSYLPEQIWISQ
ncbi:MAG: ABC transporter substrate-binding protein [Aggregatilineales bacterium]